MDSELSNEELFEESSVTMLSRPTSHKKPEMATGGQSSEPTSDSVQLLLIRMLEQQEAARAGEKDERLEERRRAQELEERRWEAEQVRQRREEEDRRAYKEEMERRLKLEIEQREQAKEDKVKRQRWQTPGEVRMQNKGGAKNASGR